MHVGVLAMVGGGGSGVGWVINGVCVRGSGCWAIAIHKLVRSGPTSTTRFLSTQVEHCCLDTNIGKQNGSNSSTICYYMTSSLNMIFCLLYLCIHTSYNCVLSFCLLMLSTPHNYINCETRVRRNAAS